MSENTIETVVKVYGKDLAERVLWSAVQGFAASVVVTQYADKSMWYAALGAGITAALAAAKGFVAKAVGNPDSASLSRDV